MKKPKEPQNLIKYWWPVIIWAGIIFVLSSFPVQRASQIYWQDFLVKKTVHLIEYGVLFALSYRALKNTFKLQLIEVVIWALVLVVFYAVTDEFHQTFTQGREGTARDVFIDFLGAMTAWWGIWRYLPKAPSRLKNWAKKWELISPQE